MKAMLFAAGLGTRLKPFTNNHPKSLFKINGVCLLERNINYLKSYGITSFIINIHYLGNQILEFLKANDNFGCEIVVSNETDKILETGGGMLKAKEYLKQNDFVMLNADVLTDLPLDSLIKYHKKENALATLAVMDRHSSRKLLFNDEFMLCGWENSATNELKISRKYAEYKKLAFSGIQIVSPEIFDKINQTGVFSIIETYLDLSKTNNISGFNHTGSRFIDVGKPEAVKIAEEMFL